MKLIISIWRMSEGRRPAAQVRETRSLRTDMIRIMETFD
jgi:hypothetical protein